MFILIKKQYSKVIDMENNLSIVKHQYEELPNNKEAEQAVIGGLMLCKAPKELVEERNDYYSGQTKAQIESVDNNLMRENDPRMPLFHERKTKVTFGSGT